MRKLYLVCYDISETRIRNKVIQFLKEDGLIRIQESIFIGWISLREKAELKQKISDVIEVNDKILMIPNLNYKRLLNDSVNHYDDDFPHWFDEVI